MVPTVQSGQGNDIQSPGFHRTITSFCSGLRRWRHAQRAAARFALQGQWLSHDDPVYARRRRNHPAARRSRRRSVHGCPGHGHERRTTDKGWSWRRRFRRTTRHVRRSRRKTGECCPSTRGTPTTHNLSRASTSRPRCERLSYGVSGRSIRIRNAPGTQVGCRSHNSQERDTARRHPKRRALPKGTVGQAGRTRQFRHPHQFRKRCREPHHAGRVSLAYAIDRRMGRGARAACRRRDAVHHRPADSRDRTGAARRDRAGKGRIARRAASQACANRLRAPIAKRRTPTRGRL